MKYGLLKYDENEQFFNVGDNIQSLAAKQFLPHVDEYINREKLAKYNGDKVKMILNGWFTHNVNDWIPSDKIEPLFVSFHINNTAAPFMLKEEGIAYLKKHEPIGCRDQYTADLLTSKGIQAYFTGCLTLTLDSYKVEDSLREDKIYIVDPLYGYTTKRKVFRNYKTFLRSVQSGKVLEIGKREKHLKKIISKEVFESAIHINQEPPAHTYTHEEKFAMAEDLLNKYAKAKLVITSRIHTALPCLALGTPVIFINGFETFVDSCRFDGIIDLFNRIDINTKTGEWTSNFGLEHEIKLDTVVTNFEKHHDIANNLKNICKEFINGK
ncbi:polysaccharide pyruvyl transferase family protein [Faecalibacter rhinopitheci]|uniref:Polysaccharide pyruvyl transferase family protein n=1 Tax=Faecalibacter rhinopitheci TaxID=2779678 RepID=A0A8J7FV29_9FLAO|nr:polysaccharide pyruvyl transferase family protein [Faecalibacter rhinopitheci]MBF0598347.1 polysaccharide pyruvyl transferase family protein [Faecalibacter rhinopitheci]